MRARLLWLCPAVVVVSWLALRTPAASPEARAAVAPTTEIKDAALATLIGRFASAARAAPRPVR